MRSAQDDDWEQPQDVRSDPLGDTESLAQGKKGTDHGAISAKPTPIPT
jgi:hypothetical protein